MQSKNFDLEILNLSHVQFRVNYYSSNKEHLEIWHPTTPKGFYTFKYQEKKVQENLELINNGKSMHFVILDKSKTKMLGHCNYTKIDNHKCWLGYSISKVFEGKSIMYEALLLTNSYVNNNLGIKEIRAGILPNNERSIKLIKRLHFGYVGQKDELEINGEMRTYDTYIQKMIKQSNIYIKKK